jgi:hypothetical protein
VDAGGKRYIWKIANYNSGNDITALEGQSLENTRLRRDIQVRKDLEG